MAKSRFTAILVLCIFSVFFIGCGSGRDGVQTESAAQREVSPAEKEPEAQEKEILHFVDAHGKEYDVQIRPDIEKHSYDWEKLDRDGGRMIYEDGVYTSRMGIDVSHYQGEIDWNKVKDSGISFVFLRIGYRGYGTEGKLCSDERFEENLQGAQDVGLDVGVYFFSQAVNEDEALEEADFVINRLKGTELQLPVVYDPERIQDVQARTDDVTGEQFTRNTIVFCDAVENAGYTPMIYSNMVWEAFEYDLTQLSDLPIWYADYEAVPQTPYRFSFWQYSESGSVNGIEGNVDLNLEFCRRQGGSGQ